MKVASYEEACKIKGVHPVKSLPTINGVPVEFQKAIIATYKLFIIYAVANAEKKKGKIVWWEPDYNDLSEKKWIGWWDMQYHEKNNPSAFRLYAAGYDHTHTYSSGGVRLCCRTEPIFRDVAKRFLELHRDMMCKPK